MEAAKLGEDKGVAEVKKGKLAEGYEGDGVTVEDDAPDKLIVEVGLLRPNGEEVGIMLSLADGLPVSETC